MMKSARRARATATSTSVVPVRRYAANTPPAQASNIATQVMTFRFLECTWPNRCFGFMSLDGMVFSEVFDLMLKRTPKRDHIPVLKSGTHRHGNVISQP